MGRPYRRFCFQLAEKIKMSVERLVDELSAAEIYEWMGYFLTQDEKFNEKYTKLAEKQKQSEMSDDDRANMVVNMFKSKTKDK